VSEIQIDPHTLRRAEERGVSVQEIEIVIREGEPLQASRGREAKFKVFDFYSIWNGRYYEQKKVTVVGSVLRVLLGHYPVVYLLGSAIVTVTVYAFYGRWMAES
jgi:hypothetical protein